MDLVKRGLESTIEAALRASPVVILEGPRGAGKTTLCERLKKSGVVRDAVSLLAEETRRRAEQGPEAFVESLAPPASIDEAQLVELTLAVKANVDRVGGVGRFLLTGSSRIGRGALGGTDPLAGRSTRVLLRPFTQSERVNAPREIVSWLFDGKLQAARFSPVGRRELVARIRTGGLPVLPGVLPGAGPLDRGAEPNHRTVHSYVESVISEEVNQPRIDRLGLIRAFRYLATLSGQLYNQESAARAIGINSQTLGRYTATLESLFLLERIPAFHSHARIAARRRAKIHVTDTALAAWALGVSDEKLVEGSDQLGPLFETFVTHELLAQGAMTDLGLDVTQWREEKGRAEIDLVMQDRSGRALAIEFKSGTRISSDWTKGIRAFRQEFNEAFSRGFVIYGGDELVEIDTDTWAVPVSALWSDPIGSHASSSPGAAGSVMFVSYVHDDDRAEGGRIVQLANDIAERYRLISGDDELTVFTDHNLRWGDEWKQRLSEELRRTTFFVPIVTPRFLKSEACRKEVVEFSAIADATGSQNFVCPILYFDPGPLSDDDVVERAIKSHQYRNWTETRYEELGNGTYRRAVDGLVHQIIQGLEGRPQSKRTTTANSNAGQPPQDDEPDLLAHVEVFHREVALFTSSVEAVVNGIGAVVAQLSAFGPELDVASRSGPATMKKVLVRLTKGIEPDLAHFDKAVVELRRNQRELDDAVKAFLAELAAGSPWRAELEDAASAIDAIQVVVYDRDELRRQRDLLIGFGRMSKDLREPMKRLSGGYTALIDVLNLPASWKAAADIARNRAL